MKIELKLISKVFNSFVKLFVKRKFMSIPKNIRSSFDYSLKSENNINPRLNSKHFS